jgi:hypothetical protein
MKTAMILGVALVLKAQDVTPQQADAAKKKMAEAMATAGNQTFQFVGGQLLNGNPIKGQPYSAEAINESTQVLADGNRIVNHSSSMIYRDSEGRERREESIHRLGPWNAEGAPAKAIFISDPVAKVSYSLDEKSHTASKMPAPLTAVSKSGVQTFSFSHAEGAPAVAVAGGVSVSGDENHVFRYETRTITGGGSAIFAAGGGSTPKTEKLGSQMIEGVLADGTRTTITIPAGQMGNEREISIVDERWYSPELQVTVMSKHSDPRMGDTSYKLTNINRAEPMRSLFEIPADYTVSEPKVRRVISKEDNQF